MADLQKVLNDAVAAGKLLPVALENIKPYLESSWLPQWARATIAELAAEQKWEELNDRFYKQNEFGTAGIRGRTISKITPSAEAGVWDNLGAPEHAAVGSATLNDFNIARATVGLYRYSDEVLKEEGASFVPKLVIAYDVRHFSRHFAELTASVWMQLGGEALLFEGPRSVPQLSFAVRHEHATAGVMITASHNPAHDNGYKVYFRDGGQIVEPHDRGIIAQVEAVPFGILGELLNIDLSRVQRMGAAEDAAYLAVLSETIIEPHLLKDFPPRLVYSPVHGTGSVAIIPALERYTGVSPEVVPEQMAFDGRFPTVKSPNPQNPEALSMAMARADKLGIDVVTATDPDDDRMGAAVRDKDGSWRVLTGNTLGSLFAEDRLSHMKEMGILPPQGHPGAVIIKTFVTTPLLDAIAKAHGVECINTLTGFKWIGHKLDLYEGQICDALAKRDVQVDYRAASLPQRRAWGLEYARYYCLGCEESYGYFGSDCVRDKDGNAAVLMLAELMARAAGEGKTLLDRLDELYLKYGYYEEDQLQVLFEGASGSAQRERVLESYQTNPPTRIAGKKVLSSRNFAKDKIIDPDGETISKEKLIIFDLEDGSCVAVRPSGTEPKIRYYFFAHAAVEGTLSETQKQVGSTIAELTAAIQSDIKNR